MPSDDPKIFCIGFHKTGTSSLGRALEILGYRVCGEVGVREPRIAEIALDLARAKLSHFDAFQDNPWPILFRELDAECPGSRFILTSREPDAWLASITRHFGARETPMRTFIYGVGHPSGNGALYLERYATHNREVRAYFAERAADFLELRFEAGDGWEKLCGFLGCKAPDTPFPHLNQERSADEVRVTKRGRGFLSKLARTTRKTVRRFGGRGVDRRN